MCRIEAAVDGVYLLAIASIDSAAEVSTKQLVINDSA